MDSFTDFESTPSQPYRTPTALCISEDKAFLNTVRVNLGKSGFIPIISTNTTEALMIITDNELDVIVCDYELSQIDGISFFEKIQEVKGEENTPATLIMTEKYAAPLLSRCTNAGASGLQIKNEPIEMIIERIISILKDTQLRNELEKSTSRRIMKGGTDLLTQVASRKQFSRRFSAESIASYRDHNDISLLFMTMDKYNWQKEAHGDQTMENILAKVAKMIEGELKSRDCIGRYSDHSFSIVLPDTDPEAAMKVANRLRKLVSSTEFGNLDHPIKITLSIGITSRSVGLRASPSEIITQALRSCTAAQELGGNRIIADNKLTGSPIFIVLGQSNQKEYLLGNYLEKENIEVRFCADVESAKTILSKTPIRLIAQIIEKEKNDNLEFLTWAKDRYSRISTMLVLLEPEASILSKAVNKAHIDYLLFFPWQESDLKNITNEVVME